MGPSTLDQVVPLADVRAKHTDAILRSKRSSKKTIGVKLLEPLTIQNIGLSSGSTFELPGLDQPYFKSGQLQELEQWNPVNPSGLHRHGADSAISEPFGNCMQIGSERAEAADTRFITSFRNGDVVLRRADIDAGGILVNRFESFRQWCIVNGKTTTSRPSL